MVALVIILAVGLYLATRLGETVTFLLGGGLAAGFIVFVAPHMTALGGH